MSDGAGAAHCPHCLGGIALEPDGVGLRCPSCGGTLFDGGEAGELLQRELGQGVEDLRELASHFGGRAVLCPACGAGGSPLTLRGVAVDLCLKCGALWLDHGELEKLTGERIRERAVDVTREAAVHRAPHRLFLSPRWSSRHGLSLALLASPVLGLALDPVLTVIVGAPLALVGLAFAFSSWVELDPQRRVLIEHSGPGFSLRRRVVPLHNLLEVRVEQTIHRDRWSRRRADMSEVETYQVVLALAAGRGREVALGPALSLLKASEEGRRVAALLRLPLQDRVRVHTVMQEPGYF